jgi:NADH-quinone oxidoreductase subunit F
LNNSLDLYTIAESYKTRSEKIKRRVVICAGTGCIASGSMEVYNAFVEEVAKTGARVVVELGQHDHRDGANNVHISKSGCQGFCAMGPLVTIYPEETLYVKVTPQDVPRIVQAAAGGEAVKDLLYRDPVTKESCQTPADITFYNRQHRVILKECGHIDPEDIGEYIARGGYRGAHKAFHQLKPEEIIDEMERSGLRGRGGGGFLTGKKWSFAFQAQSDQKYVICNGDEGDPGAFMDRSVMEGNPHSVIEGMLIAARAIGAGEGYVYVRLEYPLAIERLKKAVKDAEEAGILGNNVLGSDFSFYLHVMEGAGAFVCGEETALIASIEGKRGMPMPKPPFPAQEGLFGKPTIINNVETLATVPLIIREGWKEFRKTGTSSSPGTKTFALTGHVANTGLIEVPFGTTLREIVYNIGGGITDDQGNLTGQPFKAVQIGGPSGGCLTEEQLDLPLDFDSLQKVGAMVGSGGLVVMNQDTCMVQIARFFMKFTQNESCGKCVPCREGTKQMLSLLDDIIAGGGSEESLDVLDRLGRAVMKGSLCGLGKTAANPVLSTIDTFRQEYDQHVEHKICPTNNCKDLALPEIDGELCKGCTLCKRKCPVGAIEGEVKQPHVIDRETCIKCGACAAACKFDAISGV